MKRYLNYVKLFICLLSMLSIMVACSPGESNPTPGTQEQEASINERVVIVFPAASGSVSVTVNGAKVPTYDETSQRVVFDLLVEDNLVEKAEVIVRVGGNIVAQQTFILKSTAFASSNFAVYTKGLSEQELISRLEGSQFSIIDDSYQRTLSGDSATAELDIGKQTTQEALGSFRSLSLSVQQNASQRFQAGPNYLYTIARRPRWTSPTCENLEDLIKYARQGYETIPEDSSTSPNLLDLTNARALQASAITGNNATIAILDTGVNANDVFDCQDLGAGHGTHILELAKTLAPDVTLLSKKSCEATGKCQTTDLLRSLIDIENDSLITGQKVIANMSISSGLSEGVGQDTVLYSMFSDMIANYPSTFLVVAAAGNNGLDEDPEYASTPMYPASFSDVVPAQDQFPSLPNIISVGSLGVKTSSGQLAAAAFNPRGISVDVYAPGVRLCLNEQGCNDNNSLTGSSFATAIVSGAAALIWQQCPDISGDQVKQIIKQTASPLSNQTAGYLQLANNPDCSTNPGDNVTVTLSPSTTTLEPRATQSFTATVTGSSNTKVNWTTTSGSINGSGNTITYTAPDIEGTYTLSATSQANPASKATAVITVTRGNPVSSDFVASIGTFNDLGDVGTSLGLFIPSSILGSETFFTVDVSGPPGWNAGNIWKPEEELGFGSFEAHQLAGGTFYLNYEYLDPVSGTYDITLNIGGKTYQDSTTMDATKLLASLETLPVIDLVSGKLVGLSWEPLAGAVIYEVTLGPDSSSEPLERIITADTIVDLDTILSSEETYWYELKAYSVNPFSSPLSHTDQLNVSMDDSSFVITLDLP